MLDPLMSTSCHGDLQSQCPEGNLPGYREGEQTVPPQNGSLWHVDDFQPKAIKTQQTQENLFTSPLLPERM